MVSCTLLLICTLSQRLTLFPLTRSIVFTHPLCTHLPHWVAVRQEFLRCSFSLFDRAICLLTSVLTLRYDAIDFACPSKCGGDPTFVVGSTIPAATEMDTVGTLDDFVTPACPAFARLVNSTDPLLSFGPATSTAIPSLMTTRLRDKLSVLAATVALDTRFNGLRVHVVSAYEFPPASGTNATLHHAGQAARLNVVNVASPGTAVASIFLQHLGRLAAFAGLDWVHYADASYLYVSVIPDGCRTALDLALVLDGSGSIELTRHGGAPGNFANRVRLPGFLRHLLFPCPVVCSQLPRRLTSTAIFFWHVGPGICQGASATPDVWHHTQCLANGHCHLCLLGHAQL